MINVQKVFDFTPPSGAPNRRPSAAQIVAQWKKAGRPQRFVVQYGETFAEFEYNAGNSMFGPWFDSGNGCRGVDRLAVVRALTKEVGR